MSILRVIQPWIKQYLNAHLIDPTVHLIEEQLEARKSIDIDALTKYHNQTTAKIFKHLAKELSEYLPADSFTFSDDSSFQSRKKELKKLQNQLLKSSSSSEDDGVCKEDKKEISTQTEHRACLTLKPLHKLVENEPMHDDDIILNADLAATPSKKKHKKKRKENADVEPECSSTADPVINLVEEEEGDCPAGSSEKKKHKKKRRSISEAESSHGVDCYSDLLDQSKIGSKNDESQPILKLFMEFLKHMESLSEEKKNKFIKDVYQILRTAGSTQIESDNEENISPTDYHKLKKKKRKKSHNSESGPDDVPQEVIYLDITHDHNYGDTSRKPQKRKKDKRYEESFETEDGSGEKKKRKKSHCESHPTNIEDNVNPTEALLCPSESSKKKKKKKKKNLEDEEASASEVTYLPGDAFSLPESEKDSQRQDSSYANSSRSNNIDSAHCDILGSVINQEAGDSSESKDASSRPTSHSSQKSLIDRRLSCESGSSKITRTLRTDDFLHELNPSYDSDSDSNGGSSVLLLSHVMGDEVAIKKEPLSPDFAEQGLSNSVNAANFVKSPSRKQSRKAKSSSSSSGAVGSGSQSNVLNEFLIMPQSTNDFSLSKTFDEQDMIDQMEDSEDEESETVSSTHDERQNESTGITLNTLTNPLSIPVTIPSADTSTKQIELNDCRSLEKELLELEQCLVYAEKGTRDDQQPSTSQGPRARTPRNTIPSSGNGINIVSTKYPDHIREQKNSRKFTCYKCGLDFEEKSDFVAHWLEHVRGNVEKSSKKKKKSGPFKCRICRTKFSKESALKKHLREDCHLSTGVSNEPPKMQGQSKLFSCSFCDYKTFHRGSLRNHLVIHSDLRPFKCDLCPRAFKLHSILRKHMRECHTHSEERRFKCDECLYAFKNISALNKHKTTIHSDLRPFKCNLCDASFKVKSVLKTHQVVHSNLRPYSCDLCDYSTKLRGDLYKHKRRMHNIV